MPECATHDTEQFDGDYCNHDNFLLSGLPANDTDVWGKDPFSNQPCAEVVSTLSTPEAASAPQPATESPLSHCMDVPSGSNTFIIVPDFLSCVVEKSFDLGMVYFHSQRVSTVNVIITKLDENDDEISFDNQVN